MQCLSGVLGLFKWFERQIRRLLEKNERNKDEIPEESKERLPRQSLALLSRNDDETVGPE